ncbi:hypothetical protein TNCV_3415221 [Trichonephila clavipes]|nr:hypothetical protein TNCV_3415221 [Trichonephila clavipes]
MGAVPFPGVGTRHPFGGVKETHSPNSSVVNNNRADSVTKDSSSYSTGTSQTLDSQTPGSRTAVHALMGEKEKMSGRRNLTESTIVRSFYWSSGAV